MSIQTTSSPSRLTGSRGAAKVVAAPNRRLAWQRVYVVLAWTMMVITVAVPSARADDNDTVRTAIVSARDGSSCAALQLDPIAQQTSEDVLRSQDAYLDFRARDVPIVDPMPILKDLGFGGTKAKLLHGAYPTLAGSIKGAVLQGFQTLGDCSLTAFGASSRFNNTSGAYLTAVVLIGA